MTPTIKSHLDFIYGRETAESLLPRFQQLISKYQEQLHTAQPRRAFSQEDAILITYGDMVNQPGRPPLQSLARFLENNLQGVLNTIHLLPFYPYSSDDGFSVIDYRAVDSALGDWEDINEIGRSFNLMFDAVINHISAESSWFQQFLAGSPPYQDYFITVDPEEDLSAVFRPRALPLLTEFETANGPRHLWTTFSADQIDLNFANPDLLLEITDLLLFYVTQGASLIRLDAIGFMWKITGQSCLHLPQTHRIIQLWRAVLDQVAPHVALITETNVPHQDNITYFGDGRNEAQMVYNFSLPPLTLHAFHSGSAQTLTRWAQSLTTPSDQTTFFNFLASHDGIGLTPARALLSDEEVDAVAGRVQALGGRVSYKTNSDGSQSAYELNINYLDALADPNEPEPDTELTARRFLTSQAIMLALPGVPGIYFHSLFGSRGWPEGVEQSGRFRTINRQKLAVDRLESKLNTPGALRHRVFSGYKHLLEIRANSAAFHPNGPYEILDLNAAVFAIERKSPDQSRQFLCLHNVSNQLQIVESHDTTITLPPYSTKWLTLP